MERKCSIARTMSAHIAGLILPFMVLLLLITSAQAADEYGRKLALTPSFDSEGDLTIRIVWSAQMGPVYNGDTEAQLSFSGISTASLLPGKCNMYENSSLRSTGSVTIKAKYLNPGELKVVARCNNTKGELVIDIPDEGTPPAPKLTVDKTEVMVMEEYTLSGEIERLISSVTDYLMIRFCSDGSMTDLGWNERTETARIFKQTVVSFPNTLTENEIVYSYYLRYRDKNTGKWSAFCDPVSVKVHRKGVLPITDYEMPDQIMTGKEFVFRIVNPVNGANYSLSFWGTSITRINETSWKVMPQSSGWSSFSIDASKTGYETVSTSAFVQIIDPSATPTPTSVPTPSPEPAGYDLSKAVILEEGVYNTNTSQTNGLYLYKICPSADGVYTISSSARLTATFYLYDGEMNYLDHMTTGYAQCKITYSMKAGHTYIFASEVVSSFILERKGFVFFIDCPQWVEVGSSCTVSLHIQSNNPVHWKWLLNGKVLSEYNDSTTAVLRDLQESASLACELREENSTSAITSYPNLEVYPVINLYTGQTVMLPTPEGVNKILSVEPENRSILKNDGVKLTACRAGKTKVRINCTMKNSSGNYTRYVVVNILSGSGVIKLPEHLEKVESEAFRGISDIYVLDIPAGLQQFPSDAFDENWNLRQLCIHGDLTPEDEMISSFTTIVCYQGSNAEAYAREHELQLLYMYR